MFPGTEIRTARRVARAMRHSPFVLVLGLAACHTGDASAAPAPANDAPSVQQPAAAPLLPFERELLAAARDYRSWKRVSDKANWAPTLCRIAPLAGAQHSRSDDGDTHGRKLYFLFARDADTYVNLPWLEDTAEVLAMTSRQLVGEVVVKQSFVPVEVPRDSVPKLAANGPGDRVIPEDYAVDGEHAFRTGAAAGLYVMLKLDPGTPGTDQGWVYGTLTADGSKVTAAGRIASCMECHESAPHERLFGMSPPYGKARPTRAR
jgi:hypothetical protein